MSIDKTLEERGNRYGDFSEHAKVAQVLQTEMRECLPSGWNRLSAVQRQALTVIADKIARILSGDPNYADNWHDIQGYAKLVEDRLPKDGDRHPMTPNVVEYSSKTPNIQTLSISLVENGPDSRCRILDSEPASQMQDDSPRMAAIGQNGPTAEHYSRDLFHEIIDSPIPDFAEYCLECAKEGLQVIYKGRGWRVEKMEWHNGSHPYRIQLVTDQQP